MCSAIPVRPHMQLDLYDAFACSASLRVKFLQVFTSRSWMHRTKLLLNAEQIVVPTALSGKSLPYTICRTVNGEFPVYKVYKGNGRIVNTVVRNILGDVSAFRKDLALVCESPVKLHMGTLEVRGIHTWKIKEYLESIGL